MTTSEIVLAKQYKELFNPKWRHIAYYGGRAAGKSQATAYAILLRGRQSKIRVLATREFQNSITDSVHKLFKDLIDKHGFGDYEVLRDTIRNTNGTEIIFKGLRKDSQAIKSLEGVDICWTEEAQTITKDSIDTLIPTIRKPGSQLIWTFNRLTELDPVYTEICQNPTPDTYALKVNSDVLEAIGQLPQVLIDEREKMREREPELFPHVWLGEPISQVDNAIISRDKALNAMNRTIEPDGAIEVGVDVARFGADRSTFYKRKGLKIVGHQEYEKLSLTDLAERLESFVDFDKGIRIKVDDGGLGCVVSGTKLLTPSGWRIIDEIEPGDEVYSKDEDDNVITTTVYSNRSRETEIINAQGYEFSWSHLLPYKTRPKYPYRLGRWLDITEKSGAIFDTVFKYEADNVDFVIPEQRIDMHHGGTKLIREESIIDSDIFAIFLGWYVSEGHLDRTSKSIKITQVKKQHFAEIEQVMSAFGKVSKKKCGDGYHFQVHNMGLYRWIERNCYVGGSGFKYKAVPRWVANNSVDTIKHFLRAFRDGDGYIHHGRNYYVTSSVNLVDDLTELVNKTGKTAGNYRKGLAGSQFEIEGRTATRTEDNYVVFEYAKNGFGIQPVKHKPSMRTGKVYSLVINSDTKLMYTMAPNSKPIWTHNGGLTDIMKQRGYNIVPCNFGAAPSDKDKYNNLISEAWFYLQGIIDTIEIPNDPDLLMELTTRRWKMDSKGRRVVESKDDYKKRGYRSPDKADGLLLAFYSPEVPTVTFYDSLDRPSRSNDRVYWA